MKVKYFLALISLLCVLTSKAQFAPINATWHIGLPDGNGLGAETFIKYVNVKDTIIDSTTYSYIQGYDYKDSAFKDSFGYYPPFYLLSQEQGVIYYFLQGKKILFDLNVNIGDSVEVDYYEILLYPIEQKTRKLTITIDTIEWIKENYLANDSLRRFGISWSNGYRRGFFTEKILVSFNGAIFTCISEVPMIPEGNPYLRCYSDSNYQYKISSIACDFRNVGIKEVTKNISYNISPNPNKGNFNISFNSNEQKTIRVFDMLGSLVYTTSTNQNKINIDLPDVRKGIYFINIQTTQKQFNSKVLIE